QPRWYDLGDQDPVLLLRQGALRAAPLLELIARAQPMPEPAQFEVPVPNPGKILCMAKNYAAHAREFGAEAPAEPIFFAKLPESLIPHRAPVRIPGFLETRVAHEAELCLVLGFRDPDGKGRKYVPREYALELVAGCTVLNDVTARKLQGQDRDQKHPWLRS